MGTTGRPIDTRVREGVKRSWETERRCSDGMGCEGCVATDAIDREGLTIGEMDTDER